MPADLRAEMSRSAALANPVWVEARKNNDFATFLPVLRKNLDLRKRYIDCFDVADEPYDIVLDDYERGMKTAEVRGALRLPEGAPGAARQGGRRGTGGDEPHEHDFALEPQKVFELEVVRAFGFNDDAWRLDPTVHPFASGTGVDGHPHHDALLQASTSAASSGRCTSSATGSTSTRSTRRSSARRSRAASRSACTSRRAACGRTSSAARCRSGSHFFPRLQELFPDDVRRLRRRALVPRGQHRRAVADPRRGGRGDVQPAHHPALRARAGDARRRVPARAAAGGVEPAHVGVPRHRGAERHATACCRTCTGRAARSATSRRTRSAT